MKRIIEIPDKVVEAIQNGEDYRYDIHTAIAQSTPYNPSGDAISREALKDIAYINKGNFNTVEGIREWIDNAPTVPQVTVFAENADEKAVADLKAELQNVVEARPQGVLTEEEKKICKIYLEDLDKTHTCNEYKLLMNLIDNAPTVETERQVEKINKIPKDFVYDTETPEFYCYRNKYTGKEIHILKEPKTYTLERTQGEWINPSENPEFSNREFFYDCSICGNTQMDETNFCPNCGAKMTGGKDNE